MARIIGDDETFVVTVGDIKGGVAKTTTAMELAMGLSRRGERVTVLDTDNTGGATLWQKYVLEDEEARKNEAKDAGRTYEPQGLGFDVFAANEIGISDRTLLNNRYKGWVIIDTPPSGTSTMNTAIEVADVVIIPSQPSISDLTHAGKTYRAARQGIVLLTRAKPRTRLYRQAVEQLDAMGVTRFETCVREREEVKAMFGTTEFDRQDYASVVKELVDYVRETKGMGE